MAASELTIALAGNPNSGKTTLFNSLTGLRQHVANYPGVTVQTKEGTARHNDKSLNMVDLPGTYSLTTFSAEEVVARRVLIEQAPDVVIDVVDSSNLERNLYLATQLLELGVPLVLAFNMSDVARSRGYSIDDHRLSQLLGVPIVHTVAHKGKGMGELLDAAIAVARDKDAAIQRQRHPDYGHEVEPHVQQLTSRIEEVHDGNMHARWLAVKLLEGDAEADRRLRRTCPIHADGILAEADRLRQHIERVCGDAAEMVLADRRYGFISGACAESVTWSADSRHRASMSDKIDTVLTNRYVGLPIFALLIYAVFYLTFTLGEAPMGWIESGFGRLSAGLSHLWPQGSDSMFRSLLIDGMIGGVGGVTVFLPNIMLLFLAIAVMEDTGYMARAAFIMDHLMHKIGLHGKSFIPMLIGFGCSVPAIMATRTLEHRRDRLTTMLVVPLMSCGARLPIYALIIPAFFPQAYRAPMLWMIYFVGIILAIGAARLLRATVLRGESTPFVMELPPYRMPTARGLFIHMWERGWLYLRKAGTIILAASVVMWALTTYPKKKHFDRDYDTRIALAQAAYFDRAAGVNDADTRQAAAALEEELIQIAQARSAEQLAYTISGRAGRAMEPVIRPMGFDWKIGTALIGSLAAKEVFVAQMGIVCAVGESDTQADPLRSRLRKDYSPLVGLCIMLFCLVSTPCVATIAATRMESNSWGWAMFQFGGLTVLAYALTVAVFQIGRVLT